MRKHPAPDQPHNRLMAKAYKALPPAEVLWDTFDYKPLTGELIRKPGSTKTKRCLYNEAAGYLDTSQNYWRVRVGGKQHRAHRLIWLWVTGVDPLDKDIDHVNMDRADNRWCNLRIATKSENRANCKVRTHNKIGVKGVYTYPSGTFYSKIRHTNRLIHLGNFATVDEASEAYKQAALKYHGEFARID